MASRFAFHAEQKTILKPSTSLKQNNQTKLPVRIRVHHLSRMTYPDILSAAHPPSPFALPGKYPL